MHLDRARSAATFEREFGRDLLPTLTFDADERVGWKDDVLQVHFVDIVLSGDVDNRLAYDSGHLHVDQKLAQASIPCLTDRRRTTQQNHVMATVRRGRRAACR